MHVSGKRVDGKSLYFQFCCKLKTVLKKKKIKGWE